MHNSFAGLLGRCARQEHSLIHCGAIAAPPQTLPPGPAGTGAAAECSRSASSPAAAGTPCRRCGSSPRSARTPSGLPKPPRRHVRARATAQEEALTVAGGLDADVLHLRAVQVERAAERQVERLPWHRDQHHVQPILFHVRARPEVLLLAPQHCAPHTAITAQPGSRTVGATRAFDVLGPS